MIKLKFALHVKVLCYCSLKLCRKMELHFGKIGTGRDNSDVHQSGDILSKCSRDF